MNVTEIIDDNNDDNLITIEILPLYLLISLLPCVLSIICCVSFLSYGFIKKLINKK